MKKPTTIDFETEAITDAGKPPKPVGVAIMAPGRAPAYYAWGHPVENNCTEEAARAALKAVWGGPLLFHNAYFDIGVAWKHLGLPIPADFHDSMFSLYLVDPHADTISLKPASVKHLGMPPEEQEAVRDWLIEHGIVRKGQKDWGAYISQAPGGLVGEYAKGDVLRTRRLHDKLYPTLDARMREAYQREIRLLPHLLMNEMEGMRLDVDRLEQDIKIYEKALRYADDAIRRKLKTGVLNIDAPADVAKALKDAGIVTAFKKTPTGRDSTAKGNLTEDMFSDPEVYRLLGYRGRLETVLANSMRPWLESADGRGYIHTSWNQVRSTDTGGAKGTRTGRLSCSRFMNISKGWEGAPTPRGKLPPLPLVRRYILPDEGCVMGVRDLSQQEFRLIAHFEDGDLMRAYQQNPKIDFHDNMKGLIQKVTGQDLPRKKVKALNFGLPYGMGLGRLAEALETDVDTARKLRDAQKQAAPGLFDLDKSLKTLFREGKHIRTWGGRIYNVEPPKLVGGQMRSFEYKAISYLIQGSAADYTKEALIRYHSMKKEGRFMVTVHDEIGVSIPAKAFDSEMALLREAMNDVPGLDVPMLSDGKRGPNWADLEECS